MHRIRLRATGKRAVCLRADRRAYLHPPLRAKWHPLRPDHQATTRRSARGSQGEADQLQPKSTQHGPEKMGGAPTYLHLACHPASRRGKQLSRLSRLESVLRLTATEGRFRKVSYTANAVVDLLPCKCEENGDGENHACSAAVLTIRSAQSPRAIIRH